MCLKGVLKKDSTSSEVQDFESLGKIPLFLNLYLLILFVLPKNATALTTCGQKIVRALKSIDQKDQEAFVSN